MSSPGFLRRWWMVLVALAVIAGTGLAVYRLHGIFGSDHDVSAGQETAVHPQPHLAA